MVTFQDPPCLNSYRLTGEWGEWLSKFPWSHWETLTFERERYSPKSCIGSLSRYGARLQRLGIQSRRFAVVEGQVGRTRLHLHTLAILEWDAKVVPARALLQRGEELHRTAWETWHESYGRARVSPLSRDAIGASLYVAKYLNKTLEPQWYFLPERGWDEYLPA